MKKSRTRAVQKFIRSHRKQLGWIGLGLVVLLVGLPMVMPRSHTLNYGGDNCFRDITWLPRLYKVRSKAGYNLEHRQQKTIAGYPILSSRTCVVADSAPRGSSRSRVGLSLAYVPMSGKQFSVAAPALPQLSAQDHGGKISIREDVAITLDKEDTLFDYVIKGNATTGPCRPDSKQLKCDISGLGLIQNNKYTVTIDRLFKGESVSQVLKKTFETTDPVTIAQSSISNDAVVYDVPKQITIETNKELESAKFSLVKVVSKDKEVGVKMSMSVKGKQAILTLSEPLDRRVAYRLTVNDVVAKDKGVLLEPQIYNFTTSGGPKVTAASIGVRSVQPSVPIRITFDQALKPGQELASRVAVAVNGTAVDTTNSISGNQLILTPRSDWGLCAPFTVKLTAELSSNFDIVGDSAWQIGSRTVCYSISTIGYSAQGRPIQAWRFGSGSVKQVYTGALHGDEKSSKYLMEEWIRELDANPARLPADKTVIIIPVVNPDGFAASRRQNANNVDLNRNFPANDWKSDVTMPGGGAPVVGGGGTEALSEPESRALANFLLNERPSLLLTFHGLASIVSGNDYGPANGLAQAYASSSGYRYLPNYDTNTVFQYDTTGALEDWLRDKVGIAAILVELGSNTRSEFQKNKAALWAVVGG